MDLTGIIWRKSKRSNGSGGDCVEVADLPDGTCAVRDSKQPTSPALTVTVVEWSAFTTGLRAGEFDC
jgi:hypothetical protein